MKRFALTLSLLLGSSCAHYSAVSERKYTPDGKAWWEMHDQVIDTAIAAEDTEVLRAILLTDEYRKRFEDLYEEQAEWKAGSYFLRWRQDAALAAAKNVERFGPLLLEYYYETAAHARSLTDEEQIRFANRRLIRENPVWVGPDRMRDARYTANDIDINHNVAVVNNSFVLPLAGRGYESVWQRFRIRGIDVWIPTHLSQRWVS